MPYFRLAKYINKACAIVIAIASKDEKGKKKEEKRSVGELKKASERWCGASGCRWGIRSDQYPEALS